MKNIALFGFFLSISLFLKAQTVKDIDGNVYHIVTIGTQDWFKENLNVSRFSNGDVIPNIEDSIQWVNSEDNAARCYYRNDSLKYSKPYGALYNFVTINDSRNLCPSGWHVPSKNEWIVLQDYLGGQTVAGGKIKDTLSLYWDNTAGSTNSSGFSALPNGLRKYNGEYGSIGKEAFWWCTEKENLMMPYWSVRSGSETLYTLVINKKDGMGVRCIKGGIAAVNDVHKNINETILYPNPTSDYLSILTSIKFDRVEIVDLNSKVLINQSSEFQKIDVKSLPCGIYMVLILNNNLIVKSQKLIKQ